MVVTPGNKRGGIEDADCLQRSSHVRVVHLSLLHDRQGAVGPHSTDDHTDHAPQERAAEEGCVGKQSSGGGESNAKSGVSIGIGTSSSRPNSTECVRRALEERAAVQQRQTGTGRRMDVNSDDFAAG